jgi:aryl-alcohol dehydrogenase-like predicted oxidoreductase
MLARTSMTTAMQYAQLGRSGLKVSRLCLGTMNFGPETSEADSFKIMDRALELGINFFDTANVYGWKKGEGITEQIVGRWLAQGGGRRDRIVLATKVYGEMGTEPNQSRLSAYHIRRACDESLRRLKTDVIDLYQMHHVDRATPWEEIWQAMDVLVQQGKVIYVGSSNFAGWHITQANEAARVRGGLGLVSEQCKYNLLTRLVETEIQPACERYGVGLIPYSPIGGGLLAGSGRRGGASKLRRESEWAQREREKKAPAIEKYVALCAELGREPADVALAWVLSRPQVTAPIVGPRTMEHLESCLGALSIRLEPDTLEKLDVIFPGYRTSPEAFAW